MRPRVRLLLHRGVAQPGSALDWGSSGRGFKSRLRSEEHTSELQSQSNLVCRLLLEKKNPQPAATTTRASNHPPSANADSHSAIPALRTPISTTLRRRILSITNFSELPPIRTFPLR